ncbi:TIGR00730 family Rossman fold protein [Sphingopyxis sp. PET50]|uniref:LOG family protein n=1 Tax=Sphingopyxis sp. PET50 TaxID=2976533 RepID=UPI0021AEAA60|nr:TIGR00730 family Rossman fold protein [Sphingopyxis sp. PET50]
MSPGSSLERRRRICVFSGSSAGISGAYERAARALGKRLAQGGIDLVYGGAAVGLMGAIADATLAEGGHVTGVIPQALVDKEVAHRGLTELHIVNSMHERKAMMADLSDGFIAMPGGIGTFEELFEVWTWAQLGSHAKPCALLNILGFYDRLLEFLGHVVGQGFLKKVHRDMLIVEEDPAALLHAMAQYKAPAVGKWIGRGER